MWPNPPFGRFLGHITVTELPKQQRLRRTSVCHCGAPYRAKSHKILTKASSTAE